VSKTTEIRDLGNVAVASPNSGARGITAAKITELTSAITGVCGAAQCAAGSNGDAFVDALLKVGPLLCLIGKIVIVNTMYD
jgi:hypothetical protein